MRHKRMFLVFCKQIGRKHIGRPGYRMAAMRPAAILSRSWPVIVLAAALLPATTRAAGEPDFTGVWTTYTEPGQAPRARGGGPALPYTDEARKKVEAYRALVGPTGESPGGYCLGTGMPGSML